MIPERSSFYPDSREDFHYYTSDCRKCNGRKARERQVRRRELLNERQRGRRARRWADMPEWERKEQRAKWRDEKRARQERDPEGFRQRQLQAQKRWAEKRKREMGAQALKEMRRIERAERAERTGKRPLRALAKVKSVSGSSGNTFPAEALRAFLWTLLREAEREKRGPGSVVPMVFVPDRMVQKTVSLRLGVPTRTFYRWMNEVDEVDEMTLDRIATAHGGIMWWEINEQFAGVRAPKLREAEETIKEPATFCAWGLGCPEPVVQGRFCPEHAERLARVRVELKTDGAKLSANGGARRVESKVMKKTKKPRPTCTRDGCWESRRPGHDLCDVCQVMGYEEEDGD